jgi:hypothetical protein
MSISDEKYVSITTKRKNGETVSSPVWIAALDDGKVGFTTEATSGKVKRIANFPDVTLQPCDMRGKVKPGSTVTNATATVVTGDAVDPVQDAIKSKYGVMVTLIGWSYKVRETFSRRPSAPRAAVILTID